MTYKEIAIEFCQRKDSKAAFYFLNNLPKEGSASDLPLMVDLSAGWEAHQFAWDVLDDWLHNPEPTWTA